MREAKFNFIPESQLGGSNATPLSVSFNTKTRLLSFGRRSDGVKDIIGKHVKFYVDTTKNTLAWRMFSEGNLGDLKDMHQIKSRKVGNSEAIRLYVPHRAYNALKLSTEKKYNGMNVNSYKPAGLLTEEEFHYIHF